MDALKLLNLMTLHKALKSLIAVVAISGLITSESPAQSSFTMTEQQYDSDKKQWKAESYNYRFWVNPELHLDSVMVCGSRYPSYPWGYYDWIKVQPDVAAKLSPMLGLMSTSLYVQMHSRSNIPQTIRSFKVAGGDTMLVNLVKTHLNGSNLIEIERKAYENGEVTKWSRQRFVLSPAGDTLSEVQVSSGTDERTVSQVLITRDSLGRIISAVKGKILIDTFIFSDSQRYEYSAEGTLEAATHFTSTGVQKRFEYSDWIDYDTTFTPLLEDAHIEYGVIWLGGSGFKSYTSYVKPKWSDSLSFDHKRERSYDSEGRIASDVRSDLEKITTAQYTYYDNGDLKGVETTSTLKGFSSSVEYENGYNFQGLLDSSIFIIDDVPQVRYLFDQSFGSASVQSAEIPSELAANVGRYIQFYTPGQHELLMTNITGVIVMSINSIATTLDLSSLPSGLYFVSIDGGRPRKHLIP